MREAVRACGRGSVVTADTLLDYGRAGAAGQSATDIFDAGVELRAFAAINRPLA